MKQCSKCGASFDAQFSFCPNCGARADSVSPAQQNAAQAPQYPQYAPLQNMQPQQNAAQVPQYPQYAPPQNAQPQQNAAQAQQYPQYAPPQDMQPAPGSALKAPGGRKKKKTVIIIIIIAAALVLAGLGTWLIISLSQPNTQQVYDNYIEEGDNALADSQAGKAVEAYRKAIETDPKNVASYLRLADYYLSKNALSNAAEIIDEGLKNTDNDPKIKEKKDICEKKLQYNEQIMKGNSEKNKGDAETALGYYLSAIEINPNEQEAYIKAADCCMMLSDNERALKILFNGKEKCSAAAIDGKIEEVNKRIQEEKQRQEELKRQEEERKRQEEEAKRQEEEKKQRLLEQNLLDDEDTVALLKEKIKEEANGSPISLTLWASGDDMTFEKQLIKEFEQKFGGDGVEFKIKVVATGEDDAPVKAIENPKKAADLFFFSDDCVNYLYTAAILTKVPEIFAENVTKTNRSDTVDVCTIDGDLYAYPKSTDGMPVLYYDKRVISDDDVKSFDSLIAAAKKAGKNVFMDINNAWYSTGFFFTAGCTISYQNGRQTVELSTPQGMSAVKAMSHICENIENGFIGAPGHSGDNAFTVQGFEDGTLCAAVMGTWIGNDIKNKIGTENVGCAKLPTVLMDGEQKQLYSFGGYKLLGVNVFAQYPLTAHTLAYFLTNEASQYERYHARGTLPTNNNTLEKSDVKNDPAVTAVEDQRPYCYGMSKTVSRDYWGLGVGYTLAPELLEDKGSFDEKKYMDLLEKIDKACLDAQ